MSDPPGDSKRRSSRAPIPTPVQVRITGAARSITGFLVDLSDGGMGVVTTTETFPSGEVVTVELLVKATEKPPLLRAVVRYSRGARMGLQFLPGELGQ
jgi:hypothetical protein